MKFRFSTLLIVVTGLAILFVQHPIWDRFAIVALIEMALAVGWIAAKGRPFPWRMALGAVLACNLAVVASFFYSFDVAPHLFGDLMDRLIGSLELVFVVSNLLMILVGLLYILHKAIEAVFRLNWPTFAASPGPRIRQSSD